MDRIFYGRVEAGALVLGVVESKRGYQAGRFEAGRPLRNQDPNDVVKAYDAAIAVARKTAERYRAAGNTASARYYEGRAEALTVQAE